MRRAKERRRKASTVHVDKAVAQASWRRTRPPVTVPCRKEAQHRHKHPGAAGEQGKGGESHHVPSKLTSLNEIAREAQHVKERES